MPTAKLSRTLCELREYRMKRLDSAVLQDLWLDAETKPVSLSVSPASEKMQNLPLAKHGVGVFYGG